MKYQDDGPLGYYFEEIEIGQTLVTRGRTITETDIVQFAALTGDYNPMHTDAEFTKNHFVGQRIAHGLLSLSYAVGLIYQLGLMERTILTFRSLEMKFSQPVFIGDTIHAQLKIIEKKEMKRLGGGHLTGEIKIINQDGKTVQSGTMSLMLALKPEGE
ncbi:MAG: MaoC family dehydratase N-terminal domain-containing protein [Anaerolineaceae bacterium]|nr:MaoC family dehydratase N-terminal domain-containing protein [Anaerolineaceae bacterium]